ncbi:MAG: DUF2339 domain-containing protein [Gallionella sp.]|nr:DUF2339 domain-containing protein [Gallionella sp.]
MWFIGLMLGLITGSLFSSEAAIALGIIGLVSGALYKHHTEKPVAGDRFSALEKRVAELESKLAALQPSLSALRPAAPPSIKTEPPIPAAPVKPLIPIQDAAPATPLQPPLRAPASPPRESLPPTEPSLAGQVLNWLLTGEHAIARVGMLILFVGIGFLIKYAAEHAMFPIELRLISAVLMSAALLVTGWRLRCRHTTYALILQGGGVGILYLVTYGAYQIWHLIPAAFALPLMIFIAILSTLLAVWQNALPLAAFGVTGGFLAPLLAASDSGNHVALFTYYTILNLGILSTAWFKSWRILNLLGFLFTFAIAVLWGAKNYRPELFSSTEPFLVLFFLMYVGIALLYALRRAPDLTPAPLSYLFACLSGDNADEHASIGVNDYVDGGLIFGVPVAGFGLQAALVHDFEYGLAISSLVLGMFYMGLSRMIQLRRRGELRPLVESFLALGVIFASLAIPLAFDAEYTSAAWAVEGAGIFWFGSRQNKHMAWGFGLLLQLGAGLAFLYHNYSAIIPESPINHLLTGALLLCLSGFTSYCATRRQPTSALLAAWTAPLFLWGLGWWLFGGLNDIELYAPRIYQITQSLLFLSVTALLSSILALRWKWPHAEWPVMSFTAVLWFAAIAGIENHDHPFAHYGQLAWAVALSTHYWLLYRHEKTQSAELKRIFHTWSYLLLAALGAWEMHWLTGEYNLRNWQAASLVVVPVLLLIAVSRLRHLWPMNRNLDAYLQKGALPVVLGLGLWTVYANLTQDGASDPLPYLPLLNPIDIAHGLVILATGLWLIQIRDTRLYNRSFVLRAGGAALFVWLNAILLRTLHHWAGIAYHLDALMDSMLVQTALSLFWTLLAMTLMITAARRGMRILWLVGATLMGVVLVKLLLVDLAQSGSLERIVSFTGVGILMLLIGYFAPPPRRGAA